MGKIFSAHFVRFRAGPGSDSDLIPWLGSALDGCPRTMLPKRNIQLQSPFRGADESVGQVIGPAVSAEVVSLATFAMLVTVAARSL